MRKIIFIISLWAITVPTFAQPTKPSPTLTKQDYLLKSKHQKTAAWILLGGGTVLTGIGIGVGLNEATTTYVGILTFNPPKKTSSTGAVLFITGLAAMAGSIPLFIASGRNNRKAMSMSFKNETTPLLMKQSVVYRSIPTFTLKLTL